MVILRYELKSIIESIVNLYYALYPELTLPLLIANFMSNFKACTEKMLKTIVINSQMCTNIANLYLFVITFQNA